MVVEAGVLYRTVTIVDRIGNQVNVGREEFLDERPERVSLRKPLDLVAELKVIQDVLNIGRERIQVGLEVGLELLRLRGP